MYAAEILQETEVPASVQVYRSTYRRACRSAVTRRAYPSQRKAPSDVRNR